MRLSEKERACLISAVRKYDRNARVYLFGSRTDDGKRGGDIDLLIRSQHLGTRELRKIRMEFFQEFGEQKLDILIDEGNGHDPFVRLIRSQAVPL